MDWYYAKEGQQQGPVEENVFAALVAQGDIAPGTLVWHEGMETWRPYGAVYAENPAVTTTEGLRECILCRRFVSQEDVIPYKSGWVCAECKPLFLQRLKEGVPIPVSTSMVFAGFWIRLAAHFIDSLVVGIPGFFVNMAVGFLSSLTPNEAAAGSLMIASSMMVGPVLGAAYETWMVGRWGATLGKMACGIKIVDGEGQKVTYLRAFARYWAEILTGFTLTIGYLMMLFDDEKRTLHDRICDTRVIQTR